MKPTLTNVFVDEIPSRGKAIRLDFSNDRHFSSSVLYGDKDDVSAALLQLAKLVALDPELRDK